MEDKNSVDVTPVNKSDITKLSKYDELVQFDTENDVPRDEYFLGGSACLDIRDIRPMGDLDICIGNSLQNKKDELQLPSSADLHTNMYSSLNLSNDKILENEYVDSMAGFKIIRPEIKFSRSMESERPKRRVDRRRIHDFSQKYPEDWNRDIVHFVSEPSTTSPNGIRYQIKYMEHIIESEDVKTAYNIVDNHIRKRYPLVTPIDLRETAVSKFRNYICDNKEGMIPIADLLFSHIKEGEFIKYDILSDMIEAELGNNVTQDNRAKHIQDSHLYPVIINEDDMIVSKGSLPQAISENKYAIPYQRNNKGSVSETDCNWLKKNLSSPVDESMIRNKVREIFDYYGLNQHLILWPPLSPYYSEIQTNLESKEETTSTGKLNINDCGEFIDGIYDAQGTNEYFNEYKIYLFNNDDIDDPPRFIKFDVFSETNLLDIKKDIRDRYIDKIPVEDETLLCHTTDNFIENRIIEKYK